jgi:hypothetical protein
MRGIYMSCPGYQHWKPVNTLSHKVLKSLLLFQKSPWGFCSKSQHQICCNAFEPHHLLQHMVVNHILMLIIDEQNSMCQDKTCCNDLATKKNQDKGLDFCTCQKKITNEKTLKPNPVVIPLVTALQRISKFS